MQDGARRMRKDSEVEKEILAMASRPVSPRELFARIGDTATVLRAFNRLVTTGRIKRFGARQSFDFGHEVLYVQAGLAQAFAHDRTE